LLELAPLEFLVWIVFTCPARFDAFSFGFDDLRLVALVTLFNMPRTSSLSSSELKMLEWLDPSSNCSLSVLSHSSS
jgi:hypothetical protein